MLQLLTALLIAIAPAVTPPPALPPCATDEIGPDIPPCYWNAQTRGNGLGESFTWTGGAR
jgi:hypothetical protein